MMYRITRIRHIGFKNRFIDWFIRTYDVDMSIALNSDPHSYACFNDFFTRALKADARPLACEANAFVCPADGVVSQIGKIDDGWMTQAKGHQFNTDSLLANDTVAERFLGGRFATVYLSPRDYHRIHMPCAGQLYKMTYIPGRLFSVNQATAAGVPNLFARNERVILYFHTSLGEMALVLVGAIFVGSMSTVFEGQITPSDTRVIRHWDYDVDQHHFSKGAEIGRFNMGSTVIVLLEEQPTTFWEPSIYPESPVEMGQLLGAI